MEYLTLTSEQGREVSNELEKSLGQYLNFRHAGKSSTHTDFDDNQDNSCKEILNLDNNIITQCNSEHIYPFKPHSVNISSNELNLDNGDVGTLTRQHEPSFLINPQLQQHQIPNPDCMETALNNQQHFIPTSVKAATSEDHGQVYFRVPCQFCSRTFSRQCYLVQHINTRHSVDKPFRCPKCGKKFLNEVARDEHQKRHDGVKRFKCQYCPKTFNYKTDLNRHNLSHTGQKLHSCKICGKSFSRRDHLINHSSSQVHRRLD